MLLSTVSSLILLLSSTVSANRVRHIDPRTHANAIKALHRRHVVLESDAAVPPAVAPRTTRKRKSCSATHHTSGSSSSSSSTSGQDNSSNSTDTGSDNGSSSPGSDDNSGSNNDNSTSSSGSGSGSSNSTSSSNSTTSSSTGSSSSSGGKSGGVVHVTDSKCGANNPSPTTTTGSGPNGEESWFNCGLQGGGWTPPHMTIEQLVYADLTPDMAKSGGVFEPCGQYFDLFNTIGKEYNIPPIMMVSFAMQESTCNPKSYSADCYGLFQLSSDKCPSDKSACYDAKTNTEIAAKFINDSLPSYDYNVVEMVGQYNGWTPGMKQSSVHGACDTQQNLDYIHQMFNGWMQGKNGYNIGTIKNCSGNFKRDLTSFVPRFGAPKSKRGGWNF